jgi:hypothetical protein
LNATSPIVVAKEANTWRDDGPRLLFVVFPKSLDGLHGEAFDPPVRQPLLRQP